MVSEIAVVSGKGGTGKTTLSAAFAAIAGDILTADCDVEAPDLHILLQPDVEQTEDFIGSRIAVIERSACTECGLCKEACRFHAADPPYINPISCEGCGVCEHICPEGAITMGDKVSGRLFKSRTRFGPMVHAKLRPGGGNSGLLVTEIRRRSLEYAKNTGRKTILIDGPPGIGCPVIATVAGLRLGVVVTEPTLSGIHDMSRVLGLLNQLGVRSTVIINKHDLNRDNTRKIAHLCQKHNIEVSGKIPFSPLMTESMVARTTLPEFLPEHPLTRLLDDTWNRVIEMAVTFRS